MARSLVLNRAALSPAAQAAPRLWCVDVHDPDNAEIHC